MGVATGCGFKEIYRFPHTTVGVKKKFPRSIRTTGARLKKKGGERELNGN